MHNKSTFLIIFVLLMVVAVTPLIAHHSFAAQFDRNKPVTLVGPVTKIDWINPHARIFMDAKDANGKTVNWEIELGAPAILLRSGWTRTAIKVGEVVTVKVPAAPTAKVVWSALVIRAEAVTVSVNAWSVWPAVLLARTVSG